MIASLRALLLLTIAFMVGCSTPDHPASSGMCKGKVTMGGSPVGDVMLTLHAVEDGQGMSVKVGTDGTFSSDVVSGKYTYYFAPTSSPKSQEVMSKIPAKYLEGAMDRIIQVRGGEDIVIDIQ